MNKFSVVHRQNSDGSKCSYSYRGICSGDGQATFLTISPPHHNAYSDEIRQAVHRLLCQKHAELFAEKRRVPMPRLAP